MSRALEESGDISFAHLLPPTITDLVKQWIVEDIPSTDIGGFVVGEKIETALLYAKSSGVLCGIPFAQVVYNEFELDVEWIIEEGTYIDTSAGKVVVAKVVGKCRNILMAERTSLNIISRASGVATQARRMSNIAKEAGWHGAVAGTRKTTPGFRVVEKYALVVGGAATHRQDLSQMVMLKDNHIWSAGSITAAVHKAKRAGGFSIKIEVECQSVEEALEAAASGADIVMLDNFDPSRTQIAAQEIKEKYPFLVVEASGGITEESATSYMGPYVDVLSMGSLTHGYDCLDFSLKVQPQIAISSVDK